MTQHDDQIREPLDSNLEVERKFIVAFEALPENYRNYAHKEVIQGYLQVAEDFEIRIRKSGDTYTKTEKTGNGLSRIESEKDITKEDFDLLWPRTENARIEKVRYEIPYGRLLIELDIYESGLVVAEVEFATVEESRSFIPPEWFGEEITDDARYKNKNLAVNGYP